MTMMSKLLASAGAMVLAASASATTLTFDSQGSLDTSFSSYTEGGYTFALVAPNASTAHVGDGTGVVGTLNWHDEGANGSGTYVLMTKVGGGAFNLVGLDYNVLDFLSVSAGTFSQTFTTGSGFATLNLNGVTSVRFTAGSSGAGIDNLSVTAAAVPEPESIALMLAGLGVVGALRRRKAQ